ncbi:MAG: RES family NAD+ phosphorylase [Candidatus Thiodiazotropha taylori]|nr:RES family NAD+ phosphorylase [Candidatus Thiodiazotropha taylori]
MRVWRLTTKRHTNTAFSGIGNRKAGSRWVPSGYSAVYTSTHLSLAVLETLVHIDPFHLKNNFVVLQAEISEEIDIETLQPDTLPDDWQDGYEDPRLQAIGQDWIERASSAVLIVPSAIVPVERNIIINPLHSDFKHIKISDPAPFRFDGRLMT